LRPRLRARRRLRRVTSSRTQATQTAGSAFLVHSGIFRSRAHSIPESWYSTRDASAFKTFLSKTDVLLLALPSTSNTRHLLSATTLAYLPHTAVIVNVGRGDAIDTAALLAALDAKKLGGAALDVTDPEPLPAGHPLFGRSDVLVTPHLSGRTIHYYQRALVVFEENVKRWKAGEPLWNSVDYQKGY
jgi:phosphoglycerate dehydrogenase-like enzyme